MIDKNILPQELLTVVQEAYRARPNFYDRAAKNAYSGELPDYPIIRRAPLDRLVILYCCLEEIWEKYAALGIPDKIIEDTVSDFFRRVQCFQTKTEKIGLSKADILWFRHLYFCELFQLGSLQFQPFSMVYLDREGCGEDYMIFEPNIKKRIPQGTPVINVHIPNKTDLSPKAVEASLKTAVDFFQRYLPEHDATHFLCYSWLLYPGLSDLLSEESNIRGFSSRFEIIGTVQDASEALRRIYGRRYSRKKDYPQDTTLQCSALGHFSQLGEACGILSMDNA